MCGIGGFCDFTKDYMENKEYYQSVLEDVHQIQAHRGPDDSGIWLDRHVGFSHARLSIIDLSSGRQPILRSLDGHTWSIVYNGELYNTAELRSQLAAAGWSFETQTDTETILVAYLEYGPEFVTQLNGIFAFAIWNPVKEHLFLYRDRSGIKPLFFSRQGNQLFFASEIKGILACPGMNACLDYRGMNEIFSIGPARTYGCGVFQGIEEVLPGHYLVYTADSIKQLCYWKLESHPHEDGYKTTVEKTSSLVIDAIRRQMVSDVPICTFLSGGLDSSLVSAVCADELKKKGEQLNTFSFDFTDNGKYFQANTFQPSEDRPYVEKMVGFLESNHHFLECSTEDQTDFLKDSVDAHDLPAMADVDSSLLYFCSQVKPFNKVTLTGECADEIFGGYPWFHQKECFETHTFPWTMNLNARKLLLKDDFLDYLKMEEYVASRYEASVRETPPLPEDSPEEARRREISYLNQKWFMQTLLNRMDRTSMFCGLEARVPFADHRIIEYVWNVPWNMKTKNGVVKGLLRECGKKYLPEEILYRRKSPYPKTYDTHYEALLSHKVKQILADSTSPVLQFLDRNKMEKFLAAPSDYGKPWYGQLMAGPQMLAYVWQIDYWLRKYQPQLVW